MNWFKLQTDGLDYKNLMGGWRNGETQAYGWLEFSFSDIHWVYYVIFLMVSLWLASILYLRATLLSDKVASYCRVAIVLVAVSYLYGGYVVMLLWNIPLVEVPATIREGVFGDSFGTLNTLFSGLAFSGVLITLLFQRKDLTETRKQIAGQQIESQFYSMLNHQQEVVRSFDLQDKQTRNIIAQGRDCFRQWDEFINDLYQRYEGVLVINDVHLHSYNQIFWWYRSDLGLYFRSLYSVLRFVDNSKHPDASQYGLVVRSLLSDYELVMIFYNCLTPWGQKFTRYVYRFALFDNLDETLLLDQDHINFFTFEAYGSNRRLIEKLKSGPPAKGN